MSVSDLPCHIELDRIVDHCKRAMVLLLATGKESRPIIIEIFIMDISTVQWVFVEIGATGIIHFRDLQFVK